MTKLFLLLLLWLPGAYGASSNLEGGEIGNAFVPFNSLLGRYSLKYPANWQYFDFVTTTSFSNPAAANPETASFFSVQADRFAGIRTMAELRQHLLFFHPDESWREVELAGLGGFQNSRSPKIFYLFRGSEDLLSIRYRAENEADEGLLLRMLRGLKVE